MKNIIFDLGGVLLDFNPLEYIEYLGFSKEEGKLLQSFIWSSTEWKLADINKITYENLINGICKRNKLYEKEIRFILNNKKINGNKYILHQNEENYVYIKYLKELGYKIYLLSNTTPFDLEYNKKHYGIFQIIDGAVYSCDVGFAKPDLRCYQALLDIYHLNPKECIFVDDLIINCTMALNLGISTILYENSESLRKNLNAELEIDDYPLRLKKI